MALVEFALVLVLLLAVMFGIVDFGKAFNYWIDETHLANQGARYAAVNKNPGPGGSLQESIKERANTDELKNGGTSSVDGALNVCIDFPNGSSEVGDPVRVRVTTSYRWMSFLTGQADLAPTTTIDGSATMRLEAKPTNFSAGCTS